MKNITHKTLLAGLSLLMLALAACQREEPGKYEMTDGTPVIYYVRPADPAVADSLLAGAYMGQTICIVGDNLTSIQELYFNDIKALLNINFITKHTLFVNVPRDVPNEKLDKIIMVLKSGAKAEYDFIVRIPAPEIAKIKCEQTPEGGDVVLYGDYFFDNLTKPISITIGDYAVPYNDVVDVQKTQLTFKAPAPDVKGQISVTTAYGNSGRTKFVFHDDRGWITGFEDGYVGGWGRPTHIEEDPAYALWGKYVKLAGDLAAGAWETGGNDYTINIWGEDNGVPSGNLFPSDPATSILKFEVNVLETWSALPMIFCFFVQGELGQENYLWNDVVGPRGVWIPWLETGTYTTDGWETVAIPLANFKYNGYGVEIPLSTAFGSLGISVHNRGNDAWNGADCSPVILIDNVRVVPGE
jgi:hypothetical protein